MHSLKSTLFAASLVALSPSTARPQDENTLVVFETAQNVTCGVDKMPKEGSTWDLKAVYKGQSYNVNATLMTSYGAMHFEAGPGLGKLPMDELQMVANAITQTADRFYVLAVQDCHSRGEQALRKGNLALDFTTG